MQKNSESPLPALAVVNMVTAIQNGTGSITAQFVSNMTIINKTKTGFNNILIANTLESGRIYNIGPCSATGTKGTDTISVPAGRNITGIVLVTSCRITFADNSIITNSVIATKSSTTTAITGNGVIKIGVSTGCTPRGDSQVVAAGSVSFGKNSEVNGSVLTAQNDNTFNSTSGAPTPKFRGAQVPAGNDITITTTGTNHPTMSSTYNAHVQFYEPNSRTTQYYDTWFGQDYIGATFQGCASGTGTITTKIVG